MNELLIKPIGIIRTPFRQSAGTPLQPSRSGGAEGTVQVYARFRRGLLHLDGFERIWLIYWLHRVEKPSLRVVPFLDNREHGVFATRAPVRPAPVGMSAVRLLRVRDNGLLDVADVDMLNGTPLVDIKPYVPEFDSFPGSAAGWLEQSDARLRVADGRFTR